MGKLYHVHYVVDNFSTEPKIILKTDFLVIPEKGEVMVIGDTVYTVTDRCYHYNIDTKQIVVTLSKLFTNTIPKIKN